MNSLSEYGEKGLHLDSLSLKGFRNYDEFELNQIENLTIFTGANAIGKTSLIEAIQLMTSLQSFRTAKTIQMVNWNTDKAAVFTHISGNNRNLDMKMIIEAGKRSYYLNDKKKSIQELKGFLPSVIFTPDDLDLAKGSHSARRNAVDSLGSQLSKNFYTVKSDYLKLIRQKNQALKDQAPDIFLDSIDELLIKVGVQLLSHRSIIISKIKPLLGDFYSKITQAPERVELIYIPFWMKGKQEEWNFDKSEAFERFGALLKQQRGEERARQKAVIGPHADKVDFSINGKNAMYYASQGQQRSIVLAFKLAELTVIQQTLNQRPILLLDDVMSELDSSRRDAFVQFISDDVQTFITTTNIEYFNRDMIKKAMVVSLPIGKEVD